MTLDGVLAVILRYFSEFGTYRVVRHGGWRYRPTRRSGL